MSTKIYNAYKFDDEVTIEDVIKLLREARKRYLESVTQIMYDSYDRFCNYYGLNDVFEMSNKLQELYNSSEIDLFNFSSSCVIYFNKGNIYIQFFGLDRSFSSSIIEDCFGKITKDYHYQNQSDPWYEYDDDLTEEEKEVHEKEYKERELVWDEILDYDCPAECGLFYEFFRRSDCLQVAVNVRRKIKMSDLKNTSDITS